MGKVTLLIDSSSELHDEYLEDIKAWLYRLWKIGGSDLLSAGDAHTAYLKLSESMADDDLDRVNSAVAVWRPLEREVIKVHRLLIAEATRIERYVASLPKDDEFRDSAFDWALRLMEKAEQYWSGFE